MKKKRRLSRIICCMLLIISLIWGVKMMTFQTLVNENWHANSHSTTRFYYRIQAFLEEDLKQLSQDYKLPLTLLDDFITEEEVGIINREQTHALLMYNRGETDIFPTFEVSELLKRFDEIIALYQIKNLALSDDVIELMRIEIEDILLKNLSIIDYEQYVLNPMNVQLGNVIRVFNSSYFDTIMMLGTVGLIIGFVILWKKQIVEIGYYLSITVFLTGGILFGVSLYFHHIGYFQQNIDIMSLRQETYRLNFNDYFRENYTVGLYMMLGGLIVFLLFAIVKESKRMISGKIFKY